MASATATAKAEAEDGRPQRRFRFGGSRLGGFILALNLLSLGIVGTYAWRAYENTKQRPQAIALRVQRFESR